MARLSLHHDGATEFRSTLAQVNLYYGVTRMADHDNTHTGHNANALSYLRIKPEQVDKAVSIIRKEFGDGWLALLSSKYKSRRIKSLTGYHPIYHGLLAGVVTPVTLDIIEVATYLQYLRRAVLNCDSGLTNIVQGLKEEGQFQSFFFQLMITARLRLITSHVQIEPLISGKTPDVFFEYLATEFIFETTRPSLPEKRVKLENFAERLFFWLQDNKVNEDEQLNIQLTAKTIDLFKHERHLKETILQAKTRPGDTLSTESFAVTTYKYDGSVADFQATHSPLVSQGKELAFVGFKSMILPNPPDMDTSALPCGITVVVDLSEVMDSLWQDIADKVDNAVRQKMDQLRPLQSSGREVFIVLDLSEVATNQQVDLDRIVPRLDTNVFAQYTNLLGGIMLAQRVWDEGLRRFRMTAKLIWSPQEHPIESMFVFRNYSRIEEYNDFIDNVVGWAETDSSMCSCASGKAYQDCCKSKPTLKSRLQRYSSKPT